ncbi:MAG: hypothetical protein ACP5U1_09480, partial [Desulfomonilaceae bacterium]
MAIKSSRKPLWAIISATLCSILIVGLILARSSKFSDHEGIVARDNPKLSHTDRGQANTDTTRPIKDIVVRAVDEQIKGRPIEITDISSDNETLLSIISMNLFDESVASQVAKNLAEAIQRYTRKRFSSISELKSGKRYSIYLDENGGFKKASIELDPSNVFHCVKEANSYHSWKEDVVLEYRTEALSFQVKKNFLTTILGLHESKELSLKLIHIFRWDIDFQSDPRPGDTCKIVFERRYADDTPAGY